MADDLNVQQEQAQEKSYSPIEEKAMAMGWKPLDDFDGDPSEFRSAETFVAMEPLYRKISESSKEQKRLVAAMQHMGKTFDTLKEKAYNDAIKALRNERKDALLEGDIDKVDLIEQQLDNVKEQAAVAKQIAREQETSGADNVHPEVAAFQDRNSWYQSNGPMTAWADARGKELHAEGMSPREVLRTIEKEVKEEFPRKFTNPNRERAPSVEGGEGGKPSSKREPVLTADEERIVQTMVRSGVMTREQYIKQLKETR